MHRAEPKKTAEALLLPRCFDVITLSFHTNTHQAMPDCQPAILQPVPQQARYLTYTLIPGADPAASLRALCEVSDGDNVVAGLGLSLVSALGKNIDGLRSFPQMAARGIDIPSTPAALWLWLRGSDRGELLNQQRRLDATLFAAFQPDSVIDAFIHGSGRDLTGYEDGTENPKDGDAVAAAVSQQAGIAGSSFVAVQQWLHDFARFDAMTGTERTTASAAAAPTMRNSTTRRNRLTSNAPPRKTLSPRLLSYGVRCPGPMARAAAWCSRLSARPSMPTKRS